MKIRIVSWIALSALLSTNALAAPNASDNKKQPQQPQAVKHKERAVEATIQNRNEVYGGPAATRAPATVAPENLAAAAAIAQQATAQYFPNAAPLNPNAPGTITLPDPSQEELEQSLQQQGQALDDDILTTPVLAPEDPVIAPPGTGTFLSGPKVDPNILSPNPTLAPNGLTDEEAQRLAAARTELARQIAAQQAEQRAAQQELERQEGLGEDIARARRMLEQHRATLEAPGVVQGRLSQSTQAYVNFLNAYRANIGAIFSRLGEEIAGNQINVDEVRRHIADFRAAIAAYARETGPNGRFANPNRGGGNVASAIDALKNQIDAAKNAGMGIVDQLERDFANIPR